MRRQRRFSILFWTFIGISLLLGLRQIMADPTQFSGNERSPVVISEFMTANQSGLMDEDGDYVDWIEIHNRSSQSVNLADWTLTDTEAQPTRWTFPDISLPAGDYLIVFASGKNRSLKRTSVTDVPEEAGYLHTNFSLRSDGGFLALYAPTLRRYLDTQAIRYTPQLADISFGRYSDEAGAYGYFAAPTPGAPNPERARWQGMLPSVEFSVAHGLYDAPFSVELTTSTPHVTIRYTTDFSEPTVKHGEVYADPIHISKTTVLRAAAFQSDYLLAPITTQTYLFVEDIAEQPAAPVGFPNLWGQHEISFGGYAAGTPRLADYAMDAEIVNEPSYGSLLRDGLHALPSISLVTEMANLDIYANPRGRGREWERPVSLEFIPTNGEAPEGFTGFQINAGLRIQGGAGRWEFMPKHSFRLFFKSQYGPGQLRYKLFPDSPMNEFDTLVLRAGVDRSFAGHPPAPERVMDHRLATYVRDEWARASQIAMSGIGSHGIFVHLYLNGLYWGIYNLIERPDTSFMAAYFDGTRSDWYSANHGGSVEGRTDRFDVLLRLAREGGLAAPEKYATMLEFIEPEQFSDYVILNWYVGNEDWPENNWYVNVRFPAGRNYFFVWDAEDTWNNGAQVQLGSDGFEGAPFPNVVKLVFEALMENDDFRLTFADRLHKHLFNGGALTDEASQARWLAICNEIETAIVAESARWGDVRDDAPITLDDWYNARDAVLAQMVDNGEHLLAQVQELGYYPSIAPPQFSIDPSVVSQRVTRSVDAPFQPQQIEFHDQITLAMSTPTGTIYFTTDGTDPREQVTGDVAITAMQYTEPLLLTSAVTVRARVWDADHAGWSAHQAARFIRAVQRTDVQISEIMYNPRGGDAYEFLEIKNIGDVAMDLSSAYFEGVTFRFPRTTNIRPGQHMVLIQNFRQFRERYPIPDFHGIYEGTLSNRGETITLRDAKGGIISSVTYEDGGGWPLSADGVGDSLVWSGRGNDLNRADFWQASMYINGSPGADEPEQ